jgi:hypothetical protein
MPRDEGLALYELALAHGERAHRGTWLEVGAWCGKSAVYLGAAAEASTNCVLYSLDHHHGSEENQAGWEHFDARSSTRRRTTQHAPHVAAHDRRADSRRPCSDWSDRQRGRGALRPTARSPLHRRRSRPRRRVGRLRGLGRPRSSWADSADPRRLSRPPPTGAARPTRSTAPPSRVVTSSNAPSRARFAH